MQRSVWVMFGLLSLPFYAPALRAEEPAPKPVEEPKDADLAKLVDALGDARTATRDEAYAKLQRLGVTALPALRKATYHPSYEVRWRVERLLGEVAASEAWNETTRKQLPLKNITLALKDELLEAALKKWSAQSGVEATLSPALKASLERAPLLVTLNVKDYGAEQALERLLDDQKLTCSIAFNALVIEGGEGRRGKLLEDALSTPVGPFKFKDEGLRAALGEVLKGCPVGLALDEKVFVKEAEKNFHINLSTNKPLRLESVLALLLEGHDLGFVFDEKRILVTSKDRARNAPFTEEYNLQPLVSAMRARGNPSPYAAIVEALKTSVDRRGWTNETPVAWKGEDVLQVTQKASSQARIAAFLDALLRAEGMAQRDHGEPMEF